MPERDDRLLSGVVKILDDLNINSGDVIMDQVRDLFDTRFDSLERQINGCDSGIQMEQQLSRTLGANSDQVRRKGVSPWNEWLHTD